MYYFDNSSEVLKKSLLYSLSQESSDEYIPKSSEDFNGNPIYIGSRIRGYSKRNNRKFMVEGIVIKIYNDPTRPAKDVFNVKVDGSLKEELIFKALGGLRCLD